MVFWHSGHLIRIFKVRKFDFEVLVAVPIVVIKVGVKIIVGVVILAEVVVVVRKGR